MKVTKMILSSVFRVKIKLEKLIGEARLTHKNFKPENDNPKTIKVSSLTDSTIDGRNLS